MTHEISIVVATKDRPDDLRRLRESMRQQMVNPAEVVIVDNSRKSVEPVMSAFPELRTRYVRHWPPSAAAPFHTFAARPARRTQERWLVTQRS